ncbi:hypothetical protein DFH05DRAFT_631229 [Lentinula detonsa]|uniref:Uncharacterized protein n=1 Tax=Lentinula detonsa TaxID=2804962 RepID=A0A9W8U1U9_9AGAR|nr:hypothetical protein DFH05DRAFT_631229 [Lentinula detonsa]
MLYQVFPSGRSSSPFLILIIALFSIAAVVATPIAPYDHHWLQPRGQRTFTGMKVQLGVYNIQEGKWAPRSQDYQPFGQQTLSICFSLDPCFAVTPTGTSNDLVTFSVEVPNPSSGKQKIFWNLRGTASFYHDRKHNDPENRKRPEKESVYDVLKDVSKLQASLQELQIDITILDDVTYVTGVLKYVEEQGAIDGSLDMQLFNQIVDKCQEARKEMKEMNVKKAMSFSNIINDKDSTPRLHSQ